jgi:hypothetical protein
MLCSSELSLPPTSAGFFFIDFSLILKIEVVSLLKCWCSFEVHSAVIWIIVPFTERLEFLISNLFLNSYIYIILF